MGTGKTSLNGGEGSGRCSDEAEAGVPTEALSCPALRQTEHRGHNEVSKVGDAEVMKGLGSLGKQPASVTYGRLTYVQTRETRKGLEWDVRM